MIDALLFDYFKVIHSDLNNLEFKLDVKNRIYFPLFSSSIDHSISICVLNKENLTSSMYALVRPLIENYLRAMWVKYCVDETKIDDDLTSMHFPKQLEVLITEIDQVIPEFKESNFLKTELEPLVKNCHDFTHGGIQSISRQYTEQDTLSNLRDENEITSILKLSVLISSLAYVELIQDNIGNELLEPEKIKALSTGLIEL